MGKNCKRTQKGKWWTNRHLHRRPALEEGLLVHSTGDVLVVCACNGNKKKRQYQHALENRGIHTSCTTSRNLESPLAHMVNLIQVCLVKRCPWKDWRYPRACPLARHDLQASREGWRYPRACPCSRQHCARACWHTPAPTWGAARCKSPRRCHHTCGTTLRIRPRGQSATQVARLRGLNCTEERIAGCCEPVRVGNS